MTATRIEARGLPADRDPESPPQLNAQREAHIQHEREVRLAYERGRDDSRAFPALLCGVLIGAASASIAAWIL